MPLNTQIVGASTSTLQHDVDARWLMAYAAGLGDFNPRYMDTAAHKVIAHPVFPVCLEWPVILNTRELAGSASLTQQEASRGVHAAHDLHIYRPICAGDKLATQATMTDIRAIKPGAAYTMRLDTVDANTAELVARTYQLGIYRGVAIEGEDSACADAADQQAAVLPEMQNLADAANVEISVPISVPEGAAHTYTECARIWNPIHTDRAVALAAGLPDIILHGTATLALAVSKIVDLFTGGDPGQVRRLGGRFSAMVLMPSTITLQASLAGKTVSYQVLTEDGQAAISAGFVCLQ